MGCSRLSNVHARQRGYIFNRMASPMLKEKQQPANGIPSMGSYPRRGRRPRRPGNLLLSPIPGKTPGLGMPGPYRAAVGKPPAVRKRPQRGQDPSLRGTRKRQAVGSGLDRSGQSCARRSVPGRGGNPSPTAKTNVPVIF